MLPHRPAVFLAIVALCLAAAASSAPALALTAPDPAPPAGPPAWTDSCIYCPKWFGPPDLEIGADGRAHLAYGGDALYYAYQGPDGWRLETVDPARGAGAYARLALDPNVQPAIAYYDQVNRDLKYASREGSGWRTEIIDANDDTVDGVSFAIDPAGRPHVAYLSDHRDEYGNGTLTARYAYRDGTGWRLSEIGPANWWGNISLAVSAGGVPHVAYINYVNDDYNLVYARLDGGAWQALLQTPAMGDVSLVLDAVDNPHLLHSQWNNETASFELRYTRRDGAGWATEQVDRLRGFRSHSLRLDAEGRPHFAGHSVDDGRPNTNLPPLKGYAWYGWREADGWHFDAIEADAQYADLAWGPGGALRVAYWDGYRTIQLAEPGPLGGWSSQVIDTEEALAGPILLAVDPQDRAQVVFGGRHGLHYGTQAPAGWTLESILEPAWTPHSLAVDSLGQPHLALNEQWKSHHAWDPVPYYTRLWYAHIENGVWQRSVINDAAGYMPVIAVDGADRVHLVYYYYHPDSYLGGELNYCLDGGCTLIARHYELGGLALALDSHNNPHVSHLDNARLFYRFFDGTTWQESIGPEPEYRRVMTAVAIGPGDQPVIAYLEDDNAGTRTLYLARPGAPWQIETVLSGGDISGVSIAFDPAGVLHLIYSHAGRLWHGWRAPAGWQYEPVVPFQPGGASFAAAPDGRLLIAYIDGASGDARLAELAAPVPSRRGLFLPLILR